MTRRTSQTSADSTVDDRDSTMDVSTSPEGWEWDAVETSTLVILDEIGDVFIGQYQGEEHFDKGAESFERFSFRGVDGDLYAISKSTKLAQGMNKVKVGQWCRITYTTDIPSTRDGHNPTKDLRVDVRRRKTFG